MPASRSWAGHGIRRRTSGMLTLLRDVSMAPGEAEGVGGVVNVQM
jgi:hypothetical protein